MTAGVGLGMERRGFRVAEDEAIEGLLDASESIGEPLEELRRAVRFALRFPFLAFPALWPLFLRLAPLELPLLPPQLLLILPLLILPIPSIPPHMLRRRGLASSRTGRMAPAWAA